MNMQLGDADENCNKHRAQHYTEEFHENYIPASFYTSWITGGGAEKLLRNCQLPRDVLWFALRGYFFGVIFFFDSV